MSSTVTFTYTGAVQDYTVPVGVTSIVVEAWGAQGGNGTSGGVGGLGGYAKGTLAVTPGETLHVYVGGNDSAQFGGGGARGGANAGYGGGATDVRQSGTALTNRKIVGGGGGGASQSTAGGAGGGTTGATASGGGGTQSAGGTAGGTGATAGATGVGGNGFTNGGGGGGGYFGGGGGLGTSGGGGGGAGYVGGVTTTTLTSGLRSGTGQVILTLPNQAPNAPTLTAPANSSTIDRTVTQRFTWTFSDPDTGDSQSAFDLRYSSNGGSTWTTISGTTPNNYVDVASGTFTATSYQWQVRTYDSLGVVGPYSASSFFSAAAAPAAPTITAPTAGGTVGANPSTVTWSAPSQTAYQVRRVADLAGSADTSTVYYDTGQVTDSVTRSLSVPFETNSRFEHVEVRIQFSGLWSAWADVRVQVSYSPPPAPTVTLTPSSTTASILVAWVNPTPGGGQVAASYVDIYRSTDGGATSIRVAASQATNSSWRDYTPASGVAYSYQVVAVATNGVSAASTWTT